MRRARSRLWWRPSRSREEPVDDACPNPDEPGADGPPRRRRYVVRSVTRAGAVANLEPMAVLVALALVLGPALLVLLPIELLILARFMRQGTYVCDETLLLRGPFTTRRVARAEVQRVVIEDVRRGGARTPSRTGVAVLRDGSRIRLPGLSSSRSEPDEPDATVRALAAAARLDVWPGT
jgi:hypothetical protein